jgi:3-oxoacyl-[acyl-carrier-protein] synthase III
MIRRAKVVGTGSYLPPRVLTNDDLRQFMDTSDEWIFDRSGVRQRHYAEPGVYTSDLALEASRRAIADAGLQPRDIDCIVLATLSPDMLFPGTACFLQEKLGISEGSCACFDVRQQCSGFVYATELARACLESGIYRNVLVVGAEIHSSLMEYATRGRMVTVLFGDAAAAVVYQADESDRPDDGVFYTELHADGRGALNGVHQRGFDISHKPYLDFEVLDAEKNFELWPQMTNPRKLYTTGVLKMSEVTLNALQKNGLAIDDVDWVLAHQANIHILMDTAERLRLPKEKMLVNIHKYGNTTAATIPLLLDEFSRNGQIRRGQLLVFVAFGSGFTWGVALVRY